VSRDPVRTAILTVTLVFVVGLAALTIHAAVQGGIDVLTGFSLLVLAMLGFGVVGALRQPPGE
jgi:F0F1-type ATP synthase assembly protein I